tara:strand:+ start:8435 stop:8872 length:438 start_codon:yes stop_codon:yes gene_type:complete
MMTLRTTRTKKVMITRIGDHILKARLTPWIYTNDGTIWLASMAIGKSMRQINDWLMRKENRRRRSMDSCLTGKGRTDAMKPQLMVIYQIRKWMKEIPVGDSINLRCESALSEKQFRIWKKWFETHEDPNWIANPKWKTLFFYRAE